MNIHSEIEKLEAVAEGLKHVQELFDEREIDFSQAIKHINSARDTLTDVAAELEI